MNETNEMVERVARAIAAKDHGGQVAYATLARAAIEEMREPTEAMLEAGTNHGITAYRTSTTAIRLGPAEETWWAMIDTALSSNGKGE